MKEIPFRFFVDSMGAILLSIAAVLLVAEVTLRICGPKYYQFNNSSQEYYTNPRGYHVFLRMEDGHNVYGLHYKESPEKYRLPDISSQGHDGKEASILALGDSFTYGRGVKYEDMYTTVLGNMLSLQGYKIGIKNCGVPGHNIEKIFQTYLDEASKKHYSLVIYGFVLNDFGLKDEPYGSDFIDINNGGNVFRKVRQVSAFYNFICTLVDKIRLNGRTVRAYLESFQGRNREEKFEIIRRLNDDIRRHQGKLVILLFPLLYNFDKYHFYEIHDKITIFCKKNDILLLDLLPAFSNYKAEDLWANYTDQHPNESAHRIASEKLYNFLISNQLLAR